MVNILNVHTGNVQIVSPAQTVEDAIRSTVNDSSSESDYALIFLGKKLKPEMILSEIEHFDNKKTVRLIRQYHSTAKQSMDPAELLKNLEHCKMLYNQFADNNDPTRFESLATFIKSDNYQKNILAKHSKEIKCSSQLAQDAIMDSELLISLVIKNNDFPSKNPHCVVILKEAMVAIIKQDREEFDRNRHQQQPGPSVNFPLFQNQRRVQNATPEITLGMLNAALASATPTGNISSNVTGTSAGAGSSTGLPPNEQTLSLNDLKVKYREQLDQMRDFGFTDENENIEALSVSEGNVEMALQYIIDSRMEE